MVYPLQVADEIPKPITASHKPRVRARKYPFHVMQPGDMFFVPGAKSATMMSLSSATGKQIGVKFHTRHIRMKNVNGRWMQCLEPEGELGVAVFRPKA